MRWVTWAAVLVMACQISSESALGREGSNEISFKLHRGYAIAVRGSVGELKKTEFPGRHRDRAQCFGATHSASSTSDRNSRKIGRSYKEIG